ncbi:DUF2207 domain-containing protein [Pseudomonas sp.]|uniref:DUF2207 domain-containing protein n=1 Tax=Pseudomonas sp. TaxID=306 RepID=UPI003D12D6DF
MPGWLTRFLCLALLGLATAALANEDERITDYRVDLQVHTDGSLLVAEQITVEARGDAISRGIFRDFPVRMISLEGLQRSVTFDVLEVQRNGQPEPYQLESMGAVERVRIGSASQLLQPGRHTYRILYRTDRQLIARDGEDELYWNVTGNDWLFAIDRARISVQLPDGADVLRFDAYTGPRGAQGKAFRLVAQDGARIELETTAPLAASEGFTVAVAWPAGLIQQPALGKRLLWALQDNPGVTLGSLVLLALLGYFLWQWRRVGRDPQRGLVIPLFQAPDGLSPAAAGFVWHRGFGMAYSPAKALTVALTSMATKRALNLSDSGKGYTVKAVGKPVPPLHPGERKVYSALFDSASALTLGDSYQPRLKKALDALHASITENYHAACFRLNRQQWWRGALLALLGVPLTVLPGLAPGDLMAVCMLSLFVLAFGSFGVMALFRCLRSWRAGQRLSILPGLLFGLMFTNIGLLALVMMVNGTPSLSAWSLALVLAFAVLCVLFRWLLEAPTLHGREVLDKLEGYRDYLMLAESELLEKVANAPAMTIALYEQHLPYAMALGVEQQWSARFAKALESGLISAPKDGYQPQWYSGRRLPDPQALSSSLSSNLGRAAAVASTAPAQSSSSSFGSSSGGSSGGGSSGGGGGGGGGGGW